jgi:hypothetical protein
MNEIIENTNAHSPTKRNSIFANAARFCGLWFGVSALYIGTGGTCPCCGQQGCPAGIAGAGFLGAVLSAVVIVFKRIFSKADFHKYILVNDKSEDNEMGK